MKQGDKIFKKVFEDKKRYECLTVDDLLLNFPLEGTNVSVRRLAHESLLFAEKNNLLEYYYEKKCRFYDRKKNRISNKQKKSSSENKIELFTKIIKEGPTYVCVICNRCMHQKGTKYLIKAMQMSI